VSQRGAPPPSQLLCFSENSRGGGADAGTRRGGAACPRVAESDELDRVTVLAVRDALWLGRERCREFDLGRGPDYVYIVLSIFCLKLLFLCGVKTWETYVSVFSVSHCQCLSFSVSDTVLYVV
jgi:hypothetical protein